MKMYKRGFFVLTCLLLFLFSFAQSESIAACSPSVKLDGHPDTFTSIQAAYDYASTVPELQTTGFKLLLAGGLFSEDLVLNGGNVVLDGGYDCSFITKDSASFVYGTLTIGTGSLTYAADTGPLVVSRTLSQPVARQISSATSASARCSMPLCSPAPSSSACRIRKSFRSGMSDDSWRRP